MASTLVTGGAGFIGSNLVKALLARGDSVTVLDNFSTGKDENLADAPGARVIRGDVTDAATVLAAARGCEIIFHEAALPSVPRSIAEPVLCDRTNVLGTLRVLEAARELGVRRVVYAASSSAYGDTPTLPKVETMTPAPLSPYAVSKLAAEHYLHAYSVCYGLETVALRYFNVFGPHQDPRSEYAAVIPRFITAALRGEAPTIFGDGLQSRDFCYIDNTVEANLRAAAAPASVSGRVYNVACGVQVTLRELAAAIGGALGRELSPRFEAARPGDVRHSLADIDAARRDLGYTAAVGFREGLERTVAWYRARVRP